MKDLTPYRELVTDDGPFASIYLDASHDTSDAAAAIDLRWRQLRAELASAGADAETLAALDRAVAANTAVGRSGRVLIAAHGQVLVDELVPDPPAVSSASYSVLPDLGPLVLHAPDGLRYVVAVVDRIGAELSCYDSNGAALESDSVTGQQHPAHKVGGGGWAHRKLQQRVEDLAAHNAALVADEIDKLVRAQRAELLVLAGEVQARASVAAALSTACREILAEVDAGSRAAGADENALGNAIAELVSLRVEAKRQAVVDQFNAESRRPSGLAAAGLADVNRALRAGAANTVLLSRPASTETSTETSAILCASAGTGAQVQVTEPGDPPLPDGVGALLRYRS